MRRISLPGDAWADIYSADELPLEGEELIQAASLSAGGVISRLPDGIEGTPEEIAAARQKALLDLGLSVDESLKLTRDLQRATIVAFVAAWSLGDRPTMETLGRVPGVFVRALAAEVAVDAAKVMQGDEFDPNPLDTSTPTGSSSG